MQTNCLDVSPGNRPTEAPGRTAAEEVIQGSTGDWLDQPPRLAGAESGPRGGFVGGRQMAHQQRRGKHPYGVVERFTRWP